MEGLHFLTFFPGMNYRAEPVPVYMAYAGPQSGMILTESSGIISANL